MWKRRTCYWPWRMRSTQLHNSHKDRLEGGVKPFKRGSILTSWPAPTRGAKTTLPFFSECFYYEGWNIRRWKKNKKRFFDESLKNIRERKIKSRTTTTAIWTRDPVTAANILTHTQKRSKNSKNHISTRQLKYTTRRLVLSIFYFDRWKRKF